MSIKLVFFISIFYLQLLRYPVQLRTIHRDKALDYNFGDDEEDEFTMLVSGGFAPNFARDIRYTVSIRTTRPTAYFGDNHYCAGVIVAARAILTAAHCVVDARGIKTRPRRITVVAGTSHRLRRGKHTVEVAVSDVIPHEEYVRREKHDIAILRLKTPLPDNNDHIKIVGLSKWRVLEGKNCSVCGWGQLFYQGPYSNAAVSINLKVFPNAVCSQVYPRFFGEGMFCAADKNDWSKSVCRGDSGSPFICDNVLNGIVSWSDVCGKENFPAVFTDVAYYRDWITHVSKADRICLATKMEILIIVILGISMWKLFFNSF